MSSQQQIWTSSLGSVERRSYEVLEDMSGIIAPRGATSITLQFDYFDTEESYDFVIIKSCTTINCSNTTELGKYSGSTIPGPVTSNTGFLLIKWNSDEIETFSGWSAHWISSVITGMKIDLSGSLCVCSPKDSVRGITY
jgi:hypothetical protein